MFDESDRRARVSAGDVGSDGEPEQVDTHDDRTPRPLGNKFNKYILLPCDRIF